MAQYQLSFESTPLDTYPASLERRWATTVAGPTVQEVSPPILGMSRALRAKLSTNSRQFDALTAVDADPERATVKFRSLVKTQDALVTATVTPIFCAVLRASGATGSESGYVFTLTSQAASTGFVLGINRYAGGTLTTSYNTTDPSWADDTWFVVEGEVSGDATVSLSMSIYALADLETPIATHTRTDTDAGRISSAGAVGVGRFANGLTTHVAYAAFATGASALPTPPWDAEPDTTAPTLTSPSATATGTTTASGSVSTNEANGTLYYLASANATETDVTVKAGSSQAVSGSGVQNVTITGLTAATPYYPHYLHRDAAGNDSAVASGAQFTTSSSGTTTPKLRIDETLYTDKAKTATFSGTADVTVLNRSATRSIAYQANAVTITAGVLDITNAAFETLAAQFDVVLVVSGTVRGVFPATVVED